MSLPGNLRVVSELAADHAGYSVEDAQVMAALARAEDCHFWHLSRNQLVADRLRRLGVHPAATILELGCGGGCVAAHLARLGYAVTGVEGHLSLAMQAAARAPTAAIVVHDLARGLEALGSGTFDAVALFDVLEHLEDPLGALVQALSRAAPGGLVVGTVPALMSLWSEVDVRSGHRLRYDAVGLTALLQSVAGAELVEVVPFNRCLVPLLWLQRRAVPGRDPLASGLVVPWRPLNAALHGLLRLEHRALGSAAIPGASLWFAVRRSPASPSSSTVGRSEA